MKLSLMDPIILGSSGMALAILPQLLSATGVSPMGPAIPAQDVVRGACYQVLLNIKNIGYEDTTFGTAVTINLASGATQWWYQYNAAASPPTTTTPANVLVPVGGSNSIALWFKIPTTEPLATGKSIMVAVYDKPGTASLSPNLNGGLILDSSAGTVNFVSGFGAQITALAITKVAC